jgi:hypothetical protein
MSNIGTPNMRLDISEALREQADHIARLRRELSEHPRRHAFRDKEWVRSFTACPSPGEIRAMADRLEEMSDEDFSIATNGAVARTTLHIDDVGTVELSAPAVERVVKSYVLDFSAALEIN